MKDAVIAVAALGSAGTALAVTPSPEVAFVLQGAGVGALIGTVLVHRLKARGACVKADRIVARWTIFGGCLGLAGVLIDLVARGVS